MQLVTDAISAGVFNDLGSGSNVDVCVITADKVDYMRPQKQASVKGVRYASWGECVSFSFEYRCVNLRCHCV